ncbi:MAG: hypothetical protein ACRDNY_05350, partial [Gaiellaceae bacterium]
RWLEDYVGAWKSYDEAAIGALFSEDARYRYHPWEGADDTVTCRFDDEGRCREFTELYMRRDT